MSTAENPEFPYSSEDREELATVHALPRVSVDPDLEKARFEAIRATARQLDDQPLPMKPDAPVHTPNLDLIAREPKINPITSTHIPEFTPDEINEMFGKVSKGL